jgi:exodeoxyribonuclease V alpha subunit
MYHQHDFLIAKFSPLSGGARISAKGNMGAPLIGGEYVLIGDYEDSPKYGKTFVFSDYEVIKSQPTETTAIASYLTDNIRGVGLKISQNLTNQYKGATLTKLKQEPNITAVETGLSVELCERIQENLLRQQEEESVDIELRSWFHRANSPRHLISRIKDRYGLDVKPLTEDPYQMIKEIKGLSFRTADDLAQAMGMKPESPFRIKAGCEHAMSSLNSNSGHTCVRPSELMSEVHELTSIDGELTEDAIHELIEDDVFQKAPNDMIGFKNHIGGEQFIANDLLGRLQRGKKNEFDESIFSKLNYNLSADQYGAVFTSLNNPVSLLTGEAGSGKTTVLKSIIKVLKHYRPNNKILLLCPTGKASKRASSVTNLPAQTIHKALEPVPIASGGFRFQKNEKNLLEADVLIIDECPMVNVDMWVALLKSLPYYTKVIMVGDVNQLPAISAGKVFDDLLDFNKIPSTKLKSIHRQEMEGLIVSNSRLINKGMPMIIPTPELGNDFYFAGARTTQTIMEISVNLMLNKIPKKFGVDPIDDIQILVPSPDKGDLSAKNFNIYIQHLLKQSNPFENRMELSWLGDKVIQCKNDYTLGISNGDIGTVVQINEKNYVVEFEDTVAEIPIKNNNLKLAYAITVHKFQGSECPYIIIPLHYSFSSMVCTRNWLYTAITRAKTMVFLVGDWRQTGAMISREHPNLRQTSLGQHLTQVWNVQSNN